MSATVPVFRWESAGLSDAGRVRPRNEDAFLELRLPESGVWGVADGMGGHHHGALASRMVVEALGTLGWHARLADALSEVRGRLEAVNRRLQELAAQAASGPIGSTVALLACVLRDAACVWAGDSRVYRLRAGRLVCLTRDHSEVEELIERGLLDRRSAASHPSANVVTRAVGATARLDLECRAEEPQAGDRYLLCTDGLYREIEEADIARLLGGGTCARACAALCRAALQAGGHDNLTAVVVDCRESG